ncbi:hypothetical protein [Chryseobacterium lactis]|uniref:hypothetical protein n=1 Tax=Chryseobacterium lactis TaxID=1241981 RepID=UPI0016238A47|nr:hypothetical protein [Chryseobacterium lactis]
MKKKNCNKILIGLLVLLVSFYKAQTSPAALNIPQVPIIKSPQIYDMERFGNIPLSLNTGNVSYNVNLFQYGNIYNEAGFDIDLNYHGTGFMPSKQSNYVGLDWSLSFGGSISREVRGVADDLASNWPFTPSNNLLGYLEATKKCFDFKNNEDIYNQNYSMLTSGNGGIGIKCGTYSYELEPDKFNFNFMGINGYFFIGNNTPIIISDTPDLRIDIAELESQQYRSSYDNKRCITKPTTIKITDGKGIKYYFGGEYDNLEVSYDLSQSPKDAPYTITSWNLYRIEYPNSKVLEIKYLPAQYELGDGRFCTDGTGSIASSVQEPFLLMFDHHHINKHYFNKTNYNYNTSSGNLLFDGTIYWGNGSSTVSNPTTTYSATKKSMPSSIVLDGKEIMKFNFQRFDAYDWTTIPSLKLKNITFFNYAGKIVKEVELNYYRHKNYFFLDKIKLFRKQASSQEFLQEYGFDYYNKEDLPVENIGKTDYWGYYNNKPKPRPIPDFTVNKNTGEFTFLYGSWDPTPELCSVSLLKSVTYPTKGKSEFFYEPQKYSEKLDRNYASQFKNTLIPSEGIVGGGRISKIINYSNDGIQTGIKEYKYISNYTPNSLSTKSSGILSNYYRNYIYTKNQDGYSTTETLEVYSDNIIEATMNSSPVLYSEVTEMENNKGYTKYYFTDLKTHPDSPTFKEVDNDIGSGKNFYPANIGNINLPYRSNNYKRSKLYKQEFYDQNFVKIKSSTTEFKDIADTIANNYVTHVADRLRSKYFFKQFGGCFVPKKIEVEDIFNNSSLKTSTEIFYGGQYHLKPIRKKIVDPSGNVYETKYQYTRDLIHGIPSQPQTFVPPYRFLVNLFGNNIFSIPLVISNYKNNIFLNRTQTMYEFNYNSDMYTTLPKNILYYSEEKNITSFPFLPNPNNGSVEVVYDKYDSKGNLLQYTTKDGISTVIIWGYNQTQPIAKIENAKLTDIQQSFIDSIINASDLDGAELPNNDETALFTAFKTFRDNLPNYQITTYTYDPLIGVRSITPPSGVRENYIYDSAGRLEKVIDMDGKILKEMKYNYKN